MEKYSDNVYSEFEANGAEAMEAVSERTCLLNQCSTEQRHACMDRLRSYTANVLVNGDSPQEEEMKSVKELNKEEYQTVHHMILLLLLLLSMFIVSLHLSFSVVYYFNAFYSALLILCHFKKTISGFVFVWVACV